MAYFSGVVNIDEAIAKITERAVTNVLRNSIILNPHIGTKPEYNVVNITIEDDGSYSFTLAQNAE